MIIKLKTKLEKRVKLKKISLKNEAVCTPVQIGTLIHNADNMAIIIAEITIRDILINDHSSFMYLFKA